MPLFEIEQYELHVATLRVEAESEAEAVARLLNDEVQPSRESLVFVEVADDFGLPVESCRKLADGLRAFGIELDHDDIIPAIRSVHCVDRPAQSEID